MNLSETIIDYKKQAFLVAAAGVMIAGENGYNPLQLPAPRERRSNLLFSPVLEAQYLSDLPEQKRRGQLQEEIRTAVSEMYNVQFYKEYDLVEGKLVDPESQTMVRERVDRGEIPDESRAIREIEEKLSQGVKLVVHFSPKDDRYHYPKNVVDFWFPEEDGKIKWLRFFVENDFEQLSGIYKYLGGEKEVNSVSDLLANPVAPENYRLGGVLSLLSLERPETAVSESRIEAIAEQLIDSFYLRKGEQIFSDPELINRIYSATVAEIEKLVALMKSGGELMGVAFEQKLRAVPVQMYMDAQIRIKTFKGGGCSGKNLGVEFASTAKTGWIIVEKDGKMTVEMGSTAGKSYCEQCGCWYSGSSCPFCKSK